jgi:hypothetical protein
MVARIPDHSWKKSSFSGANACVEWRIDEVGVSVRDTKKREGAELHFTHNEWTAFIAAVRNGEADNAFSGPS